MCGLAGALALNKEGFSRNAADTLHNLLIMSTLRGVDGTGIAFGGLEDPNEVYTRKSTKVAPLFVSRTDMRVDAIRRRWFIGHTRAATVGNVQYEMCHPFQHGSVVGVHNGTANVVFTKYPDIEPGYNDSDHIYRAVAQATPENVTDVLCNIEGGAYALVWHDARVNAIRMARNADRPLYLTKHADVWYWASEPGFIQMALNRNYASPKFEAPWQIKKHHLLTIPLDGTPATVQDYRDSLPKTRPFSVSSGGNYGNSRGDLFERDAWPRGVYPTSGYAEAQPEAPYKEAMDGWLTLDDGNSIWNCPAYMAPYRHAIYQAVSGMLGEPLSNTPAGYDRNLCTLAKMCGNKDGDKHVSFTATEVNMTNGMVYGILRGNTLPDPMPVVGILSTTGMDRFKKNLKVHKGSMPLFRAVLDNLKVYCDGSIGVGVSDIHHYGWHPAGYELSKVEANIAGPQAHPHKLFSQYKDMIDWEIWED